MNVFKYRAGGRDKDIFKRDLASLKHDEFYAPNRYKLNDPCEGVCSSDELKKYIEIFYQGSNKSSKVTNAYNTLIQSLEDVLSYVDKCGVFSLSTSHLNEIMWAHYADSHRGFCIEYDLDKLISLPPSVGEYFEVLEVDYSRSTPKLNIDDINNGKFSRKLLGTKSLRWDYEKEIRVITSNFGNHSYDYRALKAIYFGLHMPEHEMDVIMSTMKGRGIKYFKLSHTKLSYDFTTIPVEDTYSNGLTYKLNVAPVEDNAVDKKNVSLNFIPYIDYLDKMTDIVRRHPYCKRVNYVDFSSEKSTPAEVFLFAWYEDTNGLLKKEYLNTKEITTLHEAIEQ